MGHYPPRAVVRQRAAACDRAGAGYTQGLASGAAWRAARLPRLRKGRFKKLCEKEGLTRDIKRNAYYEKPSERRRRKARKSLKRIVRDLA